LSPFAGSRNNPIVTDNLLVSAGSTPCTLQFRFENRNAMTIELGYRIRVIPPPRDTVREGRRRRSRACLSFLENDLSQLQSRYNVAETELTGLEQEVESLERQFEVTNKALREARELEWRSKIDVEDENQGKPPGDW
jgi:chromosome condensin MukBEF ATPase and DNA-binding subunit MukB